MCYRIDIPDVNILQPPIPNKKGVADLSQAGAVDNRLSSPRLQTVERKNDTNSVL